MTITRIGQLSGEDQSASSYISESANGYAVSSVKANTGSWSYKCSGSNADGIGLGFSSRTEIRASVYINHNGLFGGAGGASIFKIMRTGSATLPHEVVWDFATGNLQLYVSGVLKTSVAAASVGFNTLLTWMQISFTLKCHASTGFFTFYVNGTQVLTFTGVVDPVGVTAIYFGGRYLKAGNSWNSTLYFDDFYVDDTTGELDLSPSGRRFLPSFPNATGANAAFTPIGAANNWDCVDEAPPDSDTTYNKALTAGLRDTLNTSNVTVPANSVIRAAIIVPYVKKTDAATDAKISLHAYDGSTYRDGADQTLSTVYTQIFERQTVQPDGTAWTEVAFNAMQYGYKSGGTF